MAGGGVVDVKVRVSMSDLYEDIRAAVEAYVQDRCELAVRYERIRIVGELHDKANTLPGGHFEVVLLDDALEAVGLDG